MHVGAQRDAIAMKIPSGHTFTRSQQRTIVSVLSFLGLLVLHNNVVSLHMASLRASQQYERATSARIKKEMAVNNALKAKEVELRNVLADYALCENVLFSADEAQEFFDALGTACMEVGCTVKSVDYSDQKHDVATNAPEGHLMIISRTAELQVLGGYSSVVDFVETLERQSHKVWIDKLNLSVRRSDRGSIRCHLMLTVYMTENKESGSDE